MKYSMTIDGKWTPSTKKEKLEETDLETLQMHIEGMYSKKNIRKVVIEDLRSCEPISRLIDKAISNVMELMMAEHEYEGDYWRLQLLMDHDIEDIIYEIITTVAVKGKSDTLTTVCGLVSPRLASNMTAKQALTTVGDLTLQIAKTMLISLEKNEHTGTWFVKPNFQLDDQMKKFIRQTIYLPPMLVKPNKLTNNRSSGYLTMKPSSLIKGGSKKHHDFNVRLDVLNNMNSVPLKLEVGVLTKCNPTVPTHNQKTREPLTPEQIQQHKDQIEISYQVYRDLLKRGNRFYLTHEPDNRGRMYANGYHVNYQGTSYKKAMVSFADEEVVEM